MIALKIRGKTVILRWQVDDDYIAKNDEVVVSEEELPSFEPPSSSHVGVIKYDSETGTLYYEYALFEDRQKLFE